MPGQQPTIKLKKHWEALDLHWQAGEIKRAVRKVRVTELITICKRQQNAFDQEAWKLAFLMHAHKRNFYVANPDQLEPDVRQLRAARIGLRPGSPFQALWAATALRVETEGVASVADRFLLWGAPNEKGKWLKRIVGFMLRSGGVRRDLGQPSLRELQIETIIEGWAAANGITDVRTLSAVAGMAKDISLKAKPSQLDLPVSEADLNSAIEWAEGNPRLALALVRCMMRVLAHTVGGECMWRSLWLRGPAAHPDAIPGASTYSAALTRLLQAHVFGRISRKHHAGLRATTFVVDRPVRPGPVDVEHAVRALGLKVIESPSRDSIVEESP